MEAGLADVRRRSRRCSGAPSARYRRWRRPSSSARTRDTPATVRATPMTNMLGMALAQDLLGARLVRAVGVAVDEHDGDRFDAERLELVARARRDPPRRAAISTSPSARTRSLHLEAQRPLDQRLVLLEIQIVGVGPVDAADLVDVAEALGGDQRGLGAGALQDGVDGDGRAVQEQRGGPVVAAGLLDVLTLLQAHCRRRRSCAGCKSAAGRSSGSIRRCCCRRPAGQQ